MKFRKVAKGLQSLARSKAGKKVRRAIQKKAVDSAMAAISGSGMKKRLSKAIMKGATSLVRSKAGKKVRRAIQDKGVDYAMSRLGSM